MKIPFEFSSGEKQDEVVTPLGEVLLKDGSKCELFKVEDTTKLPQDAKEYLASEMERVSEGIAISEGVERQFEAGIYQLYFGFDDKSGVLGYATSHRDLERRGSRYLNKISVSPNRRGIGLASVLLDAVVRDADEVVLINAVQGDKMRGAMSGLYVKKGFVNVGDDVFIWKKEA